MDMAAVEREIKFDEILRSLLDREKTTVTQKKLAKALGVSGTTVSHYVTGRIRPSFQALVGIAAFFNVTLDYLVFGERTQLPSTAGADTLRGDVMRALAESNAYQGRQRDLIVRVHRRLSEQVERVARELLEDPQNVSPPGFFTDADALAIESCANRTRVVVRRPPADLAVGPEGAVSRGTFFDVMVGNILSGRTYQYLFHGTRATFEPYVRSYRDLLTQADIPPDVVSERLEFRVVDAELPAGIVIHDLDLGLFERREPVLWERYRDDGIIDGAFAYVLMRHEEAFAGIVLYDTYFESALRMFTRGWASARAL
jgi:transcriptional regulator with XRE-family HTH domain